jgi:hypothetical protein
MADDLFNITVNGKEHEIKMTFGLLNNLCRKVGDIEAAAVIALDTTLRDSILIELLSSRGANGKIIEPIDLDVVEVEPDAIIDLIDWAGTHVLDFFLKGLERTKKLQEANTGRIKALIPSSTGSAS